MAEYSNSPLVTYTKISPNRTSRNHAIDRFSIHCFVGEVTAKQGCNASRFTKYDAKNGASCSYVIGYDGSVGLCVEEKDRPWTSSNKANDMRAITFEVASETKNPYKVTDAALNALIDLMVDICKRNGKTKVLWFADKNKTLAYQPKSNEMVMTVHRWFANKACPGDYLYGKHGYIADEVNKKLSKKNEDKPKTQKKNPYKEPTRTLYKKTIQMHGDDVKWVQWHLENKGFLKNGIDGYFGKNTDEAVKKFQKISKIEIDGRVGATTRKYLKA